MGSLLRGLIEKYAPFLFLYIKGGFDANSKTNKKIRDALEKAKNKISKTCIIVISCQMLHGCLFDNVCYITLENTEHLIQYAKTEQEKIILTAQEEYHNGNCFIEDLIK